VKELLDKLSSYNVFNYLLPGVIFAVLAEAFTSFHFIQKDIVLGVFFYYFVGLVVSRIGSLTVEPFLKRVGFVTFSDYSDFISAVKRDSKIELLSEANNMYRTFCALIASLMALKICEYFLVALPNTKQWVGELTIVALLVLFGLSYRKQTHYVVSRVQHALKEK
jgi:hypothetical protein